MQRRNLLKSIAAAGLAGIATPREQQAQTVVEKAVRGLSRPKIKDIQQTQQNWAPPTNRKRPVLNGSRRLGRRAQMLHPMQ